MIEYFACSTCPLKPKHTKCENNFIVLNAVSLH